jgi:hypothetical protein
MPFVRISQIVNEFTKQKKYSGFDVRGNGIRSLIALPNYKTFLKNTLQSLSMMGK